MLKVQISVAHGRRLVPSYGSLHNIRRERVAVHVWSRHRGPIRKTQNKCLRRVMGAYKRTTIHMLERESDIPPIQKQIEMLAMQRAAKTQDHPVTRQINTALQKVYTDCVQRSRKAGRGKRARIPPRIWTTQVIARQRAKDLIAAGADITGGGQPRQRRRPEKLVQDTLRSQWQRNWENEAAKPGRREATWKDPWRFKPLHLYNGLKKHDATALFLLRTEVIGLNDWLARIRVPDVDPMCPCGEFRQTVNHVLHFCPRLRAQRAQLQSLTGNLRPGDALGDAKTAAAVAQWFVRVGILGQFRVARDIQGEDTSGWAPPEPLKRSER
jgi:hypothetical protein